MKIKLFSILLALCLLLCGCTAEEEPPAEPIPTDFAAAGMHLTLTEDFAEKQHVSYTALYESAELVIMVLKEEYTLFDKTDFSSQTAPEEYAALVWSANQLEGEVPVQTADDLVWFDYSRTANGTDYTYRAYVFKSDDAFWLFQFGARSDAFAALTDTIHGYATTVYFDAPYIAPEPVN